MTGSCGQQPGWAQCVVCGDRVPPGRPHPAYACDGVLRLWAMMTDSDSRMVGIEQVSRLPLVDISSVIGTPPVDTSTKGDGQ